MHVLAGAALGAQVRFGSFATDRCAAKIAPCPLFPESGPKVRALASVAKGQRSRRRPATSRYDGCAVLPSIGWAALAFERGFPAITLDVHFQDDGVVNEAGGTASHLKIENVEFSGKSGTAQIIGYDLRDRLGKQKQFKDNAWFGGYAPKRNPEIVVAVLVQAGGHGAEAAAPIARDIIKAYYDKKNGHVPTPQSLTDSTPSTPAVKPVLATVEPH